MADPLYCTVEATQHCKATTLRQKLNKIFLKGKKGRYVNYPQFPNNLEPLQNYIYKILFILHQAVFGRN